MHLKSKKKSCDANNYNIRVFTEMILKFLLVMFKFYDMRPVISFNAALFMIQAKNASFTMFHIEICASTIYSVLSWKYFEECFLRLY